MKRIVIVGAGLAGLTAGAYLSRAGYDVQLLEKNASCGGLIQTFEHEGFFFDTGARSIENAGIIRPLLSDLNIDLAMYESPVSIGIADHIVSMNHQEDISSYLKLLHELFPEHAVDIKKIARRIQKVMKSMDVIYGFDNPVFKQDFTHDREYLIKELLPWFRKFIFAVMRMNSMKEPIEAYLSKQTSNRSLADIIDQHFFKMTPSFFALGYFYVYLDYLYPKGGTGALPLKLLEKFQEQKGELFLETCIRSVNVEHKIITDQHDNEYAFDTLIWCADLKTLYEIAHLEHPHHSQTLEAVRMKQKYFATRGGDSVFTLYLGVDLPKEYFTNISYGHFFYTPSQQGLGEHHRSIRDDLIRDFDNLGKDRIISWVESYCELTTYEISIPVSRDETLAPKDKTGLVISFLFDYDLCRKVSESGWFEEFRQLIEKTMLLVLSRSVYPDIDGHIVFQKSTTPLDIEKITGNSEGGITGWTYEKDSPVINNLRKIPKSVQTPFQDILQAGQWAYSPAGIPTAILTGWYAADKIIREG